MVCGVAIHIGPVSWMAKSIHSFRVRVLQFTPFDLLRVHLRYTSASCTCLLSNTCLKCLTFLASLWDNEMYFLKSPMLEMYEAILFRIHFLPTIFFFSLSSRPLTTPITCYVLIVENTTTANVCKNGGMPKKFCRATMDNKHLCAL